MEMNPIRIRKLPKAIPIKSYSVRIHLEAIKYHKVSIAFPMVIWTWQASGNYL